jgi:hypothetical protein
MVAQAMTLHKICKLNVFIIIEPNFEMVPNNGTFVYLCWIQVANIAHNNSVLQSLNLPIDSIPGKLGLCFLDGFSFLLVKLFEFSRVH